MKNVQISQNGVSVTLNFFEASVLASVLSAVVDFPQYAKVNVTSTKEDHNIIVVLRQLAKQFKAIDDISAAEISS